MVFELLAHQPLANPVMVLDELDKTDQQRQYDPPRRSPCWNSQRTRLHRPSIRDFSIDAQPQNWIATAKQHRGHPSTAAVAHDGRCMYRPRRQSRWPTSLDRSMAACGPRALGVTH